jgi:CSLREA domain-containing protein
MEDEMHRRRTRSAARLVAAFFGVVAALAVPQPAAAATFTVNASDDLPGACPSPHCTLRAAIDAANASPGSDLITFDIPPGGPQTITPIGGLPPIVSQVEIDGTTQPGYAGTPIIELDGTLAGPANGLELRGGASFVEGLAVNRFQSPSFAGILIQGPGGDVIRGNYVGTDLAGTAALPNDAGVVIRDSERNVVGGTHPSDRNVISGNRANQVSVERGTGGNIVQGDYIGIDATGTHGLGNNMGVRVTNAPSTQIGGYLAGEGNVISLGTPSSEGVRIEGAASTDCLVAGNFIGTDATGMVAVPNSIGVIGIDAPHLVIGGPFAGTTRNVISGNVGEGVVIVNHGNTGPGVEVQQNLIGTDVTGTSPLPNQDGILVEGDRNLIGGTGGGEGNVVAGNEELGIWLSNAIGNRIEGNFVGVDRGGVVPLGNRIGIALLGDSSDNAIGGIDRGAGNVIAFNRQEGIQHAGGLRDAILSNSIFDNGALGIDLEPPGPNPSDPGDLDTGPNDLQNAPVLTRTGSSSVDGTLSSHPTTTYRIQLFSSTECDPSGFGEGERLDADFFVTTDGTGTATFSAGAAPGRAITATATDPDDNTSEFSNCATAGESAGQVTGGGQTLSATVADPLTFGFTASTNGGNGAKGQCDVIDHGLGVHVHCKDVDALAVTGTHATFSGTATVNGTDTTYRIDVDDNGEPGAGRDTFQISTGTGYTAGGTLVHGNVQVHG